jgi:hypothetical protein
MRDAGMRRISLVLALVIAIASRLEADPPDFLTDASVRLSAARYAPADLDLRWEGWIGAGIGVLRSDETTAYLNGDIETVLGNTRRQFDATQSNYHIEAGARRPFRWGEASFYVHHVSRHSVDRGKELPVDWNLLALRVRRPLKVGDQVAARLTVGIGRMVQVSTVGYQWEGRTRLEGDLFRRRWGTAYGLADLRVMKTATSDRFPRRGFMDVILEAGARAGRRRQVFEAFLAVERRNDVLLLTPGARRRLRIGVRFGFSDADDGPGATPPPSSSPWCSWR